MRKKTHEPSIARNQIKSEQHQIGTGIKKKTRKLKLKQSGVYIARGEKKKNLSTHVRDYNQSAMMRK